MAHVVPAAVQGKLTIIACWATIPLVATILVAKILKAAGLNFPATVVNRLLLDFRGQAMIDKHDIDWVLLVAEIT
ncbi:MAG: hypothetical protein IH866_05760 [Chloroflexi bacterium]|nr:hypothetical protein [Chloroflexota bacterium]